MKLFSNGETYISSKVKIIGNMEADANVTIDGEMYGNIKSKKHVMLGFSCHYEGTIECESALLCGSVSGRVIAERMIEVKAPATIVGDLISASVQVDAGVIIRGKILSNPTEPIKLPMSAQSEVEQSVEESVADQLPSDKE